MDTKDTDSAGFRQKISNSVNNLINRFRKAAGVEKINYLDNFVVDVMENHGGNLKEGIIDINDKGKFNQIIREMKEVHQEHHRNMYEWAFTFVDILFIIFALLVPMLERYAKGDYDKMIHELKADDPHLDEKIEKIKVSRKESRLFLIFCRLALIILVLLLWYLFRNKLDNYEYCSIWRYSNITVMTKLIILLLLLGKDTYGYINH